MEAADKDYRQSSIAEIVEFHADHPFLFSIRHNSSGLILFTGRVSDFTEEGPPRERSFSESAQQLFSDLPRRMSELNPFTDTKDPKFKHWERTYSKN